ncbi:hypothetical protein [Aliihoeflea sp. PC F10.4]
MKIYVCAMFTALCIAVMPASASGIDRERAHADSFGNLVIYSPAGYKRIVVGAGEAASGHKTTGSYHETNASRVARHGGERLHLTRARDCGFGAVLLHGRSYMYGLPDGVVPTPADVLCR